MNEIVDIARSGGGLVTTAQVVAAGIPRARISDLVKRGKLERVQRGVYCLADAWEDEYLAAQLRFPKGVFSDNTALFLLGYSDRSPFRLTMTFPRAYRATAARKSNIEVRTCSNDVLDLFSWIERSHWILEDHLHLDSELFLNIPAHLARDIHSAEIYGSFRWIIEPYDAPANGGLT